MLGNKKIKLSGFRVIFLGLILVTGITVTAVAEVETNTVEVNCTRTSPPPTFTPIPTKITIGNSLVLAKTVPGNSKSLIAYRVYLSQAGIVKSLNIYVEKAAGYLRLGIYNESFQRPGVLKAKTNEFKPSRGWNTRNVTSPILLEPGSYWICFQGIQ